MQYKILFVDDETANLRLLERLFRNGYEVFTAPSGAEALELLAVHDVALIISDQRMPTMTGCEFLKQAAEMRPQTVRIMLTGYTDAGALVDAINSGIVYKYINKPWVNEDLQQTVKRSLQHYETTKGQRQLQLHNERLQSRLKSTTDSFVEVVMKMSEMRMPGAREHSEQTAQYSAQIGEKLGMERPELERLSLAAFLHEAALFGIPKHLLLKETPLTHEEMQVVKTHIEPGLKMLDSVPDLSEIVSILRFQYEHFDGTGQPSGYSNDQIPLDARIIAVANAYDTMRRPRADRSAWSHDEAVRSLEFDAGKRFDPLVVNTLRTLNLTFLVEEEVMELTLA